MVGSVAEVDRRLLVVTAVVMVGAGLWLGWVVAGRVSRV